MEDRWVLSYPFCVLCFVQVVAHMMPDLPNVGLERDIEQFTVSTLSLLFSLDLSVLYLTYHRVTDVVVVEKTLWLIT